ncbi:MAG: hypothetical protein SX243_18780 [Acidobacteriota bacterium]|nr:hypothetical protein [Acidobacteriota bacterium]
MKKPERHPKLVRASGSTLIFLTLLTLIPWSPSLADSSEVRRHLVWRGDSENVLAEAIEESSHDEAGDLLVWKLLTPEQNRALWTFEHIAEEGAFVGSLEDLESGWSARLAVSTGEESSRYETEGVRGLVQDLRDSQPEIRISLETSDGFQIEHREAFRTAPDPNETSWQDLFQAALAEEAVGSTLPASTVEEIRFLHNVGQSTSQNTGFDWQLIRFLYDELQRTWRTKETEEDPYSSVDWEAGTGTITVGDQEDPRSTYRELRERFEPEKSEQPPEETERHEEALRDEQGPEHTP